MGENGMRGFDGVKYNMRVEVLDWIEDDIPMVDGLDGVYDLLPWQYICDEEDEDRYVWTNKYYVMGRGTK